MWIVVPHHSHLHYASSIQLNFAVRIWEAVTLDDVAAHDNFSQAQRYILPKALRGSRRFDAVTDYATT